MVICLSIRLLKTPVRQTWWNEVSS